MISPDHPSESKPPPGIPHEGLVVLAILIMTGALGLAHALITPTWANVEEAGHYEHIRLQAELGRAPTMADRDNVLLDAIQDSRVWMHHSLGEAGTMRNAYLSDPALWATLRDDLASRPGYSAEGSRNSQLQEPPAYYVLSSLVLGMVIGQGLDAQILVLRLISVVIGMGAVWMAYLAMGELLPQGHRGRVIVPALIGVHSSFILIASSVGNTVLAVLAVTFAVYVSLRVIRRGLSWLNAGLLLAGIVVCVVSKPTALPGVGVIVVSPLLALPPMWRRRVGLGAVLAGVLGLAVLFTWQRPAAWYPARAEDDRVDGEVPHGRHAIRTGGRTEVWQMLTAEQAREIAGKTVTISFWTDREVAGKSLYLQSARDQAQQSPVTSRREGVSITEDGWIYHTLVYDVPVNTQCASLAVGLGEDAAYDGVVMVVGDYGSAAPPEIEDRSGRSVSWDGHSVDNLIRNGSGERGWPLVRPAIERLLPDRLADSGLQISSRLTTFLDWGGNAQIVEQSVRWLFSSFWSRFSWTVPGYPRGVIIGLGVLCVMALTGMIRLFRHVGGTPQGRALALMGVALVLVWGMALLRIDAPNIYNNICDRYQGRFISTGYYIVPGILPMLAFFYLGLAEWVGPRGRRIMGSLLVLGLFALTVISLVGRQIPAYLHFYGIDLDPGWWMIQW